MAYPELAWRRLEPLPPAGSNHCERWRDHRKVISGIRQLLTTGARWRDLHARHGPCKTFSEHHRRCSAEEPGNDCSSRCRPKPTPRVGSTGGCGRLAEAVQEVRHSAAPGSRRRQRRGPGAAPGARASRSRRSTS
ncbi:transposase [Streptomyces sp. cg28]|uniref:transposase n=1 Tax=Streptomyces sp. cg28 TaxID=3403457 RepID=UPI003B2116CF